MMEYLRIIRNLIGLFLVCILMSCIVQKESKIVKQDIQIGMSEDEVVNKLGKPYKISAQENEKIYFYKETLWAGKTHVVIENRLIFNNKVLLKIEQGEEETDAGKVEIRNVITN